MSQKEAPVKYFLVLMTCFSFSCTTSAQNFPKKQFPDLEVHVIFKDELINDLNSLFKWGKINSLFSFLPLFLSSYKIPKARRSNNFFRNLKVFIKN